MKKQYLVIKIIIVTIIILCCIYYAISAPKETVELRNKIDESLNSYGIPAIGDPEIKTVRLPKNLNKDMGWSLTNTFCEKEGYNLEKYKGKRLSKWAFDTVDLCDSCSLQFLFKSKVYILLYGDEIACVYKTIGDAVPNITWASRVLSCNKELTNNERANFCYYESKSRYADEGKLLCEIFVGKYKWKCYSYFKKGDEIFCEKLDKFEDKRDCLWHIAVKTGNLDLCERIEDKSRRNGCYKGVAEYLQGKNNSKVK